MKTILTIIIIAMLSLSLASQDYKPLVENGKKWSTHVEMIDFYHTYWTEFTDDTIVNGNLYKKVKVSTTIFYPNGFTVGYIREDTSKRVYFMNLELEEGLLYDFNVNQGDTIIFHNKAGGNPFLDFFNIYEETIVFVDSVYYSSTINLNYVDACGMCSTFNLLDNVERKIILLRNIDENISEYDRGKEIWIEGIGSISGILESGLFLDNNNMFIAKCYLLCHFANNEHIYYYPFYNTCFYTQVFINEFNSNFTRVYPNPLEKNELLTLSLNEKVSGIQIFDIHGLSVQYEIANFSVSGYQYNYFLNISSRPSGIYFIKILTQNKTYYEKIIKID